MELDIIGIVFTIAFLAFAITCIFFVKVFLKIKGGSGFSLETGDKIKTILNNDSDLDQFESKYNVKARDLKILIYSRRIGILLIVLALIMYVFKFG